MGRRLRSHFDQLVPGRSTHERVRSRQEAQKSSHDARAKERTFSVGDSVFVRDFGNRSTKWLQGTVLQQIAPLTYRIELSDGRVIRRHVDCVRSRSPFAAMPTEPEDWVLPSPSNAASNDAEVSENNQQEPRRSSRRRVPPDRYGIPVTFD